MASPQIRQLPKYGGAAAGQWQRTKTHLNGKNLAYGENPKLIGCLIQNRVTLGKDENCVPNVSR